MKRSTRRILTTHTGSLPRAEDLLPLLLAKDRAEAYDEAVFQARVREATAEVVRKQRECGLDVVNDGEAGKISYSTYVADRLSGFGGESAPLGLADVREFPGFARRMSGPSMSRPACTGAVAYTGQKSVQRDIENLSAALDSSAAEEAFLSAASPGVISLFLSDDFYKSHESYLSALADAMKEEYDAIHQAGFLLQLDCPDLAMGRHLQFADADLDTFRRNVALHVEALNHAVRDIPSERLRLHLCWGNYEGPHHRDVPLHDIIDIVLTARPMAISFEAANPRHAHEWKVFESVPLPQDKLLIPGVLDSTTNYIEHPELVAQRIRSFTQVVGAENVIAGTDCGFATFASATTVDPDIAWAKLRALAEGAELASREEYR